MNLPANILRLLSVKFPALFIKYEGACNGMYSFPAWHAKWER